MFKRLFGKNKRKRAFRRKNYPNKKIYSNKRLNSNYKRLVKNNNFYNSSQQNSIFSSIIISMGFMILSLAIFSFTKQLQPILRNERLKFLCTYQIGDKKNKNYNNAKIKLEKIVGDSDKFCMNFIFPKEKSKKGIRFIPIIKNIILRFI